MRLEGFFFIKFEELFYRNGYSSKHDFIYPWGRLSKKLSIFSVREYELTKYLDTVILEDIITPEVRVVHCARCNLRRPQPHICRKYQTLIRLGLSTAPPSNSFFTCLLFAFGPTSSSSRS